MENSLFSVSIERRIPGANYSGTTVKVTINNLPKGATEAEILEALETPDLAARLMDDMIQRRFSEKVNAISPTEAQTRVDVNAFCDPEPEEGKTPVNPIFECRETKQDEPQGTGHKTQDTLPLKSAAAAMSAEIAQVAIEKGMCAGCGGTGRVFVTDDETSFNGKWQECKTCQGMGVAVRTSAPLKECPRCKGKLEYDPFADEKFTGTYCVNCDWYEETQKDPSEVLETALQLIKDGFSQPAKELVGAIDSEIENRKSKIENPDIPANDDVSLTRTVFGVTLDPTNHEGPITEINVDGTGGGQLKAVNSAVSAALKPFGYGGDLRHVTCLAILQEYGDINGVPARTELDSTRSLTKAEAHLILSWFEFARPQSLALLAEATQLRKVS